uniref:Uncharacterized protein n=1 Tax=Arion vulgaris TaxID=1028688 RepID=A0A0B7C460_9EUPU
MPSSLKRSCLEDCSISPISRLNESHNVIPDTRYQFEELSSTPASPCYYTHDKNKPLFSTLGHYMCP